ncbi:uncharacterized protein LOC111378067 [Olea europaea var. sylvestris]|uniref:uncharacterized protein LOC111378067 n=1 Tax=Olea europaea var. sylvestris TaxID=158386 RepID=UPI000C1D0BC3|nr:uncharacterized protein LOC111378067 [Olea europaea var. sylvestris]
MSWVRWFYDACIPLNALQSPYFKLALDAIAVIGPEFKGSSYNNIRVNLLRDCKKECQLLVNTYRSQWINNGCTIMVDGWIDQRHRTLINFLVYCSSEIVFIKSYDALDVVKDAQTMCNLFSEIVEWVGPRNVVHMVANNAANYVAAGKLLHDKYDHNFWSLYTAHCLNLILKDISSMPHVHSLALHVSKITIFVYNHTIYLFFLFWLRKILEWKEIVHPVVTRFATTFLTLKNIYDHKQALQSLATSRHFTTYRLSKSTNGRLVSYIILDNKFWEDCLMVVKIVVPIIRLLQIVDSHEKPSLCYVYDGMHRA